jgi:hypothetical protein
MAKRKGIEKKAALLHQHFKGELQKQDENELGEWSHENLQKNREKYLRQNFPWLYEGYKIPTS